MPLSDRRVAAVGTICWHDPGVRCWCRCILLIGSMAAHHPQATDGPSSNRQNPRKQIFLGPPRSRRRLNMLAQLWRAVPVPLLTFLIAPMAVLRRQSSIVCCTNFIALLHLEGANSNKIVKN